MAASTNRALAKRANHLEERMASKRKKTKPSSRKRRRRKILAAQARKPVDSATLLPPMPSPV